ncbi:MAG: nucleoside recognition domain-containing protein [Solirubrobacteraceae bacterium]
MILSYLWSAFFILGLIFIFTKAIFFGEIALIDSSIKNLFESTKTSVEISIGLIGIMALFLGFMKIAEKAGVVNYLSRKVNPFFSILFPEIPKNHPVIGTMMLNFSANFLGLDNAATPFGLKAMEELEEINTNKGTASNSQIMFTVLHASGLTFIPVSIIGYRLEALANNPTDIFLPILIATSSAALAGIIIVSIYQKINLFKWPFISTIGCLVLFFSGIIWLINSFLNVEEVKIFTSLFSNTIIFSLFLIFIIGGLIRKINVFDSFIEGAKESFNISVKIIPYLVGMLAAISILRSSGILDLITLGIGNVVEFAGFNSDFVNALPTALMKPISGSGARGLMIETMKTYGADSFVGYLACVFQGSSDTTFYILALYYGSINTSKTRYSLQASLLAELVGVIVAILISYVFYQGIY